MKRFLNLPTLLAVILFLLSCNMKEQNPLLMEWHTPHGTIPFDRLRPAHFEPAVLQAMEAQHKAIEQIVVNAESPTFQNTIIPLARSESELNLLQTLMSCLHATESSEQLDEAMAKLMPEIEKNSLEILQNEKLFARVKTVVESDEVAALNTEEQRLLQEIYTDFIDAGANLQGKDKRRFIEIQQALTTLAIQFDQNLLKDRNNFQLVLTEKDLAGIPQIIRDQYAKNAAELGKEGYVVTLGNADYMAFMNYADRRDLRQRIYIAYQTCASKPNENCNTEVVRQMMNLRMEKAQLLGYHNYAELTIKNRMAQTPEKVYELLHQLRDNYKPTAQKEHDDIERLARETEGGDFVLRPWDDAYYAEKLKQKSMNFNSEEMRPYLELEAVKKGIFGLAHTLYGLNFTLDKEIPVYNPQVEAYEVTDKDGAYLAVLYMDFYSRKTKQDGCWVEVIKQQEIDANGNDSRPHVTLNLNIAAPKQGKPVLMSYYDYNSFLHEFGHALHSILTKCHYAKLSGTNVYWDFVELPSQIMENFTNEKEMLKTFAYHYQTGELIPDTLVDKVQQSARFKVASLCLRQLVFGYIDMAMHTIQQPFEGNIEEYEHEASKDVVLIEPAEGTCITTKFSHIWSGGYSAGYYSYKWAEVLAADAFSRFQEEGVFNPEVAASFRKEILERGDTEHPMDLYKRFRGHEPSIYPLLRHDGIIQEGGQQ